MKAELYAKAAHNAVGQVRKYTGEPYWHHCRSVALSTATYLPEHCVEAAWLHDVLEDTSVTEQQLREEFSTEVVDLVVELTDVSKPEDGNRATRKELDRRHLAKASAEAQTIKCCDLLDNAKSISKYDRHFWRVFRREGDALLEVMTKADRKAWQAARKAFC